MMLLATLTGIVRSLSGGRGRKEGGDGMRKKRRDPSDDTQVLHNAMQEVDKTQTAASERIERGAQQLERTAREAAREIKKYRTDPPATRLKPKPA